MTTLVTIDELRGDADYLLGPNGPLELMGLKEVGDTLGIKPGNVRTTARLPAPVVTHLPNRPLWLASDIREFAERKRRERQ